MPSSGERESNWLFAAAELLVRTGPGQQRLRQRHSVAPITRGLL
jgi:hypothetical protein